MRSFTFPDSSAPLTLGDEVPVSQQQDFKQVARLLPAPLRRRDRQAMPPEDLVEQLMALGDGNLSAGIRRVADATEV